MKKIIWAILSALPMVASAGVYECNVGGKTTFQSKPCSTATVGQARTMNSQSTQTKSDFSKMQSETHSMNFSECKTRVLALQLLASRKSLKTTVTNDTSNAYTAKVCAIDGAVLLTCSALDRKMIIRKMGVCS